MNEQRRQSGKAILYGQVVQLRHHFSNKFLSISTSEAASLNVTNLRVDLRSHSDKSNLFRIMPRYKVRAEGDTIMQGDQIVLQSVKANSALAVASSLAPL